MPIEPNKQCAIRARRKNCATNIEWKLSGNAAELFEEFLVRDILVEWPRFVIRTQLSRPLWVKRGPRVSPSKVRFASS